MRKLYVPLVDIVRPALLALIGLALVGGLLTFRLGVLPKGLSPVEQPIVQSVQTKTLSGADILTQNSLYLPHKAGLYALEKTGIDSVRAIRAIGVVFGLLGVVAMFSILNRWHTRRIALLTTLLYATSSWFLYTSRLASPEVCYLLTPWLIYFGVRLQQNNLQFWGLAAIMLTVTMLLYVPGLVWLIIPAAIWQRRRVANELQEAGRLQSVLLIMLNVSLLVPLALTFFNDPGQIKIWLGASDTTNLLELVKNLVGVPMQLFLRSDFQPSSHLGRLPYLDLASAAFMALGAYRYYFARRLDRTKLLAAGLVICSVLSAFNFQAATSLLPFLYILAAAGLTLLLQQWFTVFPRNPLARNLGVGLILVVVGLASFYHARRYFIAWPRTPETRAVYSLPEFD